MHKADIKVGTQYALRERRGEAFQRIKILAHIRGGKWKAEWIDPNPGLVHYAESQNLIVPWRELRTFVREESDKARLLEQSERDGYQRESPLERAAEQVFDSVGETLSFWRATLATFASGGHGIGAHDVRNPLRVAGLVSPTGFDTSCNVKFNGIAA